MAWKDTIVGRLFVTVLGGTVAGVITWYVTKPSQTSLPHNEIATANNDTKHLYGRKPVETAHFLRDGKKKYIKYAQSDVSIAFNEEGSEGYALLTITSSEVGVIRRQILGVNQSVSFKGANGSNYLLTILNVDFSAKHAKIDVAKISLLQN